MDDIRRVQRGPKKVLKKWARLDQNKKAPINLRSLGLAIAVFLLVLSILDVLTGGRVTGNPDNNLWTVGVRATTILFVYLFRFQTQTHEVSVLIFLLLGILILEAVDINRSSNTFCDPVCDRPRVLPSSPAELVSLYKDTTREAHSRHELIPNQYKLLEQRDDLYDKLQTACKPIFDAVTKHAPDFASLGLPLTARVIEGKYKNAHALGDGRMFFTERMVTDFETHEKFLDSFLGDTLDMCLCSITGLIGCNAEGFYKDAAMSPKDVIVKAKYMNVIEHEADLFGCYLTQLSGLPHNSCLSALDKLRDSDAVLAALGEKERARRMEAYEDHPPVKTRKEHILGRLESPRNRTLRYLETSADGTLYYEVGSIGLRRPQQEVDGAYIAVEGFARVAVVLTAAVIFRSTCAEAWERVVTVQGLNVHLPSWWLARRSELRARPVAIAVVSLAARLAILTYFSLRPIWARMCDTVQDVVAAKETLLARVKGISTLVLCVVLSLALLVNGIGGQLSTILEFCGVILPPGRRAEPATAAAPAAPATASVHAAAPAIVGDYDDVAGFRGRNARAAGGAEAHSPSPGPRARRKQK